MDFRSRYKYNPKEDLLGKGGFSRVFKAVDVLLDREVALKVFNSEQSQQYDLITEIKKVIKFHHENLCRYYDVAILETVTAFGEEEHVQVGVMEYLDGGELKKFLIKNPQYLDSLLADVLKGLSYLHKKGIIHRDLKPQNILIKVEEDGPVAKITDFGISKALDTLNDNNSALMGTVEYMAPEQFNPQKYGVDGQISTQLDLWSFGIMVFELIRGENLFGSRSAGTSAEVVMSNILAEDYLEKVKLLPAPYDEIVRLCVIKKASDRVRSADELLAILSASGIGTRPTISLNTGPISTSYNDETIVLPNAANSASFSDETQVIDFNTARNLSEPKKEIPKNMPPEIAAFDDSDATMVIDLPENLRDIPVPAKAPVPEVKKAVMPAEPTKAKGITAAASESPVSDTEKKEPLAVKDVASEVVEAKQEISVLSKPAPMVEPQPVPAPASLPETAKPVENKVKENSAAIQKEVPVKEEILPIASTPVTAPPGAKEVEATIQTIPAVEEVAPVATEEANEKPVEEKAAEVKIPEAPIEKPEAKQAEVKPVAAPSPEKQESKQKPAGQTKLADKVNNPIVPSKPVASATNKVAADTKNENARTNEGKAAKPAPIVEERRNPVPVAIPPKKSDNYLIAAIATAVVFAVLAFFLIKGKSSPEAPAPAASTGAPAAAEASNTNTAADAPATTSAGNNSSAETPSGAGSASSEQVSGKVFNAGSATQYSFTGSLKNGKPEGKGVQTFADGSSLSINFSNGKPNGKTSFVSADGSKYQLQFSGGKGTNATATLQDGSMYKGPFVLEGGKVYPNGKGSMTWADGDKYVGNWTRGKKTNGTFYYKDGALYKGSFVNDKREGKGKYMYADGSYYEGEFRNDDINGNGSRYNSSGELIESGTFKNGKLVK